MSDALAQALDLDPTLAEAWSQRGSLLRELGRPAEAAHSFEQALAHGADEALHRFYLASVRGETLEHPPASYVQNLFDDYAAEFQSHLVRALKYRAHEVLLDPLREGDRQFAHMLDLGCGTGLCARRLQGRVACIDGVDLSAQMVAQAHGWRIDRLWEAPLREDQGRPVMGWYVHLQPALT